MKRPGNPKNFLSPEEKQLIEAAVAATEKQTSAEIKVAICRHCWGDIREKARKIFAKHKLQKTALRNCVLILLVIANREFLIFGDQGIHEKAGQELWDSVRDKMAEFFRQDKFGEGHAAGSGWIRMNLRKYPWSGNIILTTPLRRSRQIPALKADCWGLSTRALKICCE